MQRGWNQTCHVICNRVAETFDVFVSRKVVDATSVIDETSSTLWLYRRKFAPIRASLRMRTATTNGLIDGSSEVSLRRIALLLIQVHPGVSGDGP